MRIAQVSPLYERVPPTEYGGTERIVSYLTEELVKQGHEVTLFASGDSVTNARLVSPCSRSLRTDPSVIDSMAYHFLLLELVFRHLSEFDFVHFHIDYLHFPLSRRIPLSQITTLHGRLDYPDLVPLFGEYREMPVTSISNSQRKPLPWLNWQGTVYHGLPRHLYRFRETPGSYLAFLGRVSPEKGLDRAIEIARRSGMPLKIAAKVDKVDREYYEAVIRPLLASYPGAEFLGEIGDAEKEAFLGNARALLFPIDWPEPFGLVMIEAMACGTPVIAFRRGSVDEVMRDGVTGYIVDNIAEAVLAVEQIGQVDRQGCREFFERNYSAARMATDYVHIYQQCVSARETEESRAEYFGGKRGRHYTAEGSVLRPGNLIAS